MNNFIDVPGKLRHYQVPIWNSFGYNYLEGKGKVRNFIVNAARRSGKDHIASMAIKAAALKNVGTYMIIFPTTTDARSIMMENIDPYSGKSKLDMYFGDVMTSFNKTSKVMTLCSGSVIRLAGLNDCAKYRGSSINGVAISEYAHCLSNEIEEVLSPMLNEVKGFKFIVTTPDGQNHFYDLVERVKDGKDPRTVYFEQPVSYTKHLDDEQLEGSLQDLINRYDHELGQMMFEQEYYCIFHEGSAGSIYSQEDISHSISDKQLAVDANKPLYASFDIGGNTAVCIFQDDGQHINFIDSHEKYAKDIGYYVEWIKSNYSNRVICVVPHDGNRETIENDFITLGKKIEKLGLQVRHLKRCKTKQERIEIVRMYWPVIKINKDLDVTNALRHYKYKLDRDKAVTTYRPVDNQYTHYADSFGYAIRFIDNERENMPKNDIYTKSIGSDFGLWRRKRR